MTPVNQGRQGHSYLAHGYHVLSDVELPLPPADVSDPTAPQLVLRRGAARPVPRHPETGEQLAFVMDRANGSYYAFTRSKTGVVLRFFGAVDIVADRTLTMLTTHSDPDFPDDITPVVAGGAVMAVRLVLDGHLVLHASAVSADCGAVAFVGASGMGKSTLAALMAAEGLPVLTDDVLRVDFNESRTCLVWPGASELRLRPAAQSMAGSHAASEVRRTADGRIAVRQATVAPGPVPLACVVVPSPRRDLSRVDVERLAPADALKLLTGFPRVAGWQEPVTLLRQFAQLGELARSVPVLVLRMPWGPPFAPGAAREALDAVQQAIQR